MNINIKKIRPLFNQVIVTMNKYSLDDAKEGGLISAAKLQLPVMEYQTVVAVGSMVRNIEVGDLVRINPKRYEIKKFEDGSLKDNVITENPVVKYNFPIVRMDNVDYLILHDNDIDFVITEFEKVEEPSDIIEVDNAPIL